MGVFAVGRRFQQRRLQQRSLRQQGGFTLVELLVVVAIILVLIGLLLPSLLASRESAKRSACQNNMRQIAVALLSYELDWKEFPPGRETIGPSPKHVTGRNGVYVFLLPYLEQEALSKEIQPFIERGVYRYSQRNFYKESIPVLKCPSSKIRGSRIVQRDRRYQPIESTVADYTGIGSVSKFVDGEFQKYEGVMIQRHRSSGRSVTVQTITDGLSNTACFTERAGLPDVFYLQQSTKHSSHAQNRYCAWSVVGAATFFSVKKSENLILNDDFYPRKDTAGPYILNVINTYTPYSFHGTGINTSICDGSVKFLKNEMDAEVWFQLVQKDDGQTVGKF